MDSSDQALIIYYGSHLRKFALCAKDGTIMSPLSMPAVEMEKPEDAISFYFNQLDIRKYPKTAIVAVSSPVIAGEDSIRVKNSFYPLVISKIKKRFKFEKLLVYNNFYMSAYEFPYVDAGEFVNLGGEAKNIDPAAPKGLIGVGEGLGTAILVAKEGGVGNMIIPCEAGHINLFVARDMEHARIIKYLVKEYGAHEIEDVLSHRGLESIYNAYCYFDQRPRVHSRFIDIISSALSGDNVSKKSFNLFFMLLGIFAGNFALSTGAHGGIYFVSSSGMLHNYEVLEHIAESAFRKAFENVSGMKYLKQIPTFACAREATVFDGLAHFATDVLNGVLKNLEN